MKKRPHLLYAFVVLIGYSIITCFGATQYMVGDTSGWDISTDLHTWVKDKTFTVGDSLVFQYSSSHSVSELARENFEGCNTTHVLQSYNSTGNNTVTLNEPGERYFVCGNKLHCLGGMKMKVVVENNQAHVPAGSPMPTNGSDRGTRSGLPNPSSKHNKEIPTSSASFGHSGLGTLFCWFVLLVLFDFNVFVLPEKL